MTARHSRPWPEWLPARILLIGLVGIVLMSTAACTPRTRVVEIIVPRGTQERLDRGETVTIMPARLEFRVGETLRIENRDIVDQPVGPYVVPAGNTMEMTYGAPGRFQGMCLLSEGETYEIIVTE